MTFRRIALFIAIAAALSLCAGAAGQAGIDAPATPAVSQWAQLAKLSSSSFFAYGNGNSVAISGNVVVVGAPSGGFASVYVMPSGGWGNMVETATLKASDELNCGSFGNSVAISGNTILVGDPSSLCFPAQPGAAYVFVEPANGWSGTLTQTAKLTASDAVAGDNVGSSVSISGNTVVAGAPLQSNSAGAAYVFVEPAGGWTNGNQTAKLTAQDSQANQQLGLSASASGGVIVAGSPYRKVGTAQSQGAVYVFVKPVAGWTNATQTAVLTASDGNQYADLGISVAISSQTVVAGAYGATVGSNQVQGAAYVFVQPSGGWTNMIQTAKLTTAGGHAGDEFGASVATDGNTILAGAPNYSHSGTPFAAPFFHEGAVYVFIKPAGGWVNTTQAARLTGSDARLGAYFGASASISGKLAVAGALFNNRNLGAGYIFSSLTQ